jgi:hypothetical protein
MSFSHRWFAGALALAAAIAVAAPISAQQRPSSPEGVTALTVPIPAATASSNSILLRLATESSTNPTAAPLPPMRESQSVALMIVGGAGMIVGSLIDGDTGTIIMVGGGVIGLVGLFQYLR